MVIGNLLYGFGLRSLHVKGISAANAAQVVAPGAEIDSQMAYGCSKGLTHVARAAVAEHGGSEQFFKTSVVCEP